MKSSKETGTYRPFEDLKGLLKKKQFPVPSGEQEKPIAEPVDQFDVTADDDDALFDRAMAGVEPMEREHVYADKGPVSPVRPPQRDEEAEALARLEDLVRGGDGFIISDTPEYMEGIGYGVNPEISRRLHQGDFSVQAHIDLHGMGAEGARAAFEDFLKEAILSGKTAVLVVHGRGLSSPQEPVLKTKVKEWLTSGPWRKWVIAFTSARACDGGAGATYVLLRKRPATKRYRKQHLKK